MINNRRIFFTELKSKSLLWLNKEIKKNFLVEINFLNSNNEIKKNLKKIKIHWLRSKTPINNLGEPFGGKVSDAVLVPLNFFGTQKRALLIISHEDFNYFLTGVIDETKKIILSKEGLGLTFLEIFFNKSKKHWDYDSNSFRTKRFNPLNSEIGAIESLKLTPWNTVLAFEKFNEKENKGFIYEIDPQSLSYVKLEVFNDYVIKNFFINIKPQKKVKVYFIDSKTQNFFSFESFYFFNLNFPQNNKNILEQGSIHKLNPNELEEYEKKIFNQLKKINQNQTLTKLCLELDSKQKLVFENHKNNSLVFLECLS
jgi:hypothetical protein